MTQPDAAAPPDAPAPHAARSPAVVRIAELVAAPGRIDDLIAAAWTNAAEARAAAGCLSAEVVSVPGRNDTVHVISRWHTMDELRAFLSWHEGIAHRLIARAAAQPPTATHYRLAPEPAS